MGYTLQKLPNEAIVLRIVDKNYDMARDVAAASKATEDLLDTLTEKVIYITDMSQLPPISLEAASVAANVTSRGSDSLYHHRAIKRVIMVTTDPVLKMAAHGVEAKIYGNVHMEIVDTLDQALASARS